MNVINNISDVTVSSVNNTFLNDFLKLLATLFIGVFGGYTLNPIPKWLMNLFQNSKIFKFLILFMSGIISTYPTNVNKIIHSFISSIIILVIFSIFRYIDRRYEKKEKI